MLFLRGFAVCTTCFGPEPAVKRTVKMVSLLFRCYSRLPSASALTLARFVLNQNLVRNHRCCLARAGNLTTGRSYSSERDQDHPKQKVVVVGIPNPFIWFRTRIYYFLIRTYFDKEFSIEEFTEGAKQAFSHVSRLLSRCQFEALDGLVAKDVSMMLMKQEVQSAAGSLMMSHGSVADREAGGEVRLAAGQLPERPVRRARGHHVHDAGGRGDLLRRQREEVRQHPDAVLVPDERPAS
ncbi:m-AAA protease-interacting protein 1, mitochondrial isoform 4-T4 [Anableps anableps]